MNTIALVLLVLLVLLLTLIADLLVDAVVSIVTASHILARADPWIPPRRERGGTRRILQGVVATGLVVLWILRR